MTVNNDIDDDSATKHGDSHSALCSVLGSVPEGSALNPQPFQSQLGLDHRTGGQRRSSLEPQTELDHNVGPLRGF